MLHLKLLEARNLSRRDLFSKSDPYCIMTVGSQSVTSKYILDNQSPVWNQYFTFALPPQQQLYNTDLQIRVMDYDTFNSHEQLGVAMVPLSSLQFVTNQWIDKWIPLASARRGEIHIQLKMEPTLTSMQSQSMSYGMPQQQQQPMMNPGMNMMMPQQSSPMMMGMQQPQQMMGASGMMMPPQQSSMYPSTMPMQSQQMGYGMMPQQSMMPPQQCMPQQSMMPQQSYPSTMYPNVNRGYY